MSVYTGTPLPLPPHACMHPQECFLFDIRAYIFIYLCVYIYIYKVYMYI